LGERLVRSVMASDAIRKLRGDVSSRKLALVIVILVTGGMASFLSGYFNSELHLSGTGADGSGAFGGDAGARDEDAVRVRLRDVSLRLHAAENTNTDQQYSWSVDALRSAQQAPTTGRFAIISGYDESKYDVMEGLSSDTKAKYAAWHGYSYFMHAVRPAEISSAGLVVDSLYAHWDAFEWVMWTDVDALITNVEIQLESIVSMVEENKHVVVSRDWGESQISPAVFMVRTTPEGLKFMKRLAIEVENGGNKRSVLLAMRDGMHASDAEEMKYVQYVPQHLINAYPKISFKFEPYNASTPEHNPSHAFWSVGDLFVHVVNCIAQAPEHMDISCCNGIAAYYHRQFKLSMRKAIQNSAVVSPDKPAISAANDWRRAFGAELCFRASASPAH